MGDPATANNQPLNRTAYKITGKASNYMPEIIYIHKEPGGELLFIVQKFMASIHLPMAVMYMGMTWEAGGRATA